MREPNPRTSRLVLAGGVLAALVLGGGGFLLGRTTIDRDDPPVASPLPSDIPTPARSEGETTDRTLDRSDLIALAAAAADARAAGGAPDAAIADAVGRRFEIRLPFGCGGPSGETSEATMRWRYDSENEALRLHVEPVQWSSDDWWGPNDQRGSLEIEGFWIPRPWTSSEECPAANDQPSAVGAEPLTLPGQTLAIGEAFDGSSSRRGRRDGRPYQAVIRVPNDEVDTSRGFRFRLIGRVAEGPYGSVFCRQRGGPEQRPVCLIATVIDEVVIENGATNETLATWDVARRRIGEE